MILCPNCRKKMKGKRYFEQLLILCYDCPDCKIYQKNGTWHIPEPLLPTAKQKRDILFINNRLHLQLEALTKDQCIRDINKYYKKATLTPQIKIKSYENPIFIKTQEQNP